MKQSLGWLRQQATWKAFSFTFSLISILVPKSKWYATSLGIARFLGRTAGVFAPKQVNVSIASFVPRLLHRYLDQLASYDPFFPIPLVIEGEEHLKAYLDEPGGFVIASAHIPFLKMVLPLVRNLAEGKRELRAVLRHPEGPEKNLLYAWNDKPWLALRADHTLLIHARSLLRGGGCMILAVDRDQGEVISANIFRFVGKLQSRVLTSFTELLPDGRIILRLMVPPGPRCKTDQEIQANLHFVAENVRRILQGEIAAKVARPVIAVASGFEESRARELHRVHLYSTMQLQARMKSLENVLRERTEAIGQRALLEERLAVLKHEFQNRVGA